MNLTSLPAPDVVYRADRSDGPDVQVQLFSKFAADGLLGLFSRLDTTARRPMKDGARLRIRDLCHKEPIRSLYQAKRCFSGLALHVQV